MSDAVAPVRAPISRRRVLAGMAWSVPVIAVVSATPAFAASTQVAEGAVLVWDNVQIWQANGRRITGNLGIRLKYPAQTGTANVVLMLYRADNNQLIETLNVTGIAVSQSDTQRSYTFDTQLETGRRYCVVAIASGTLTMWQPGGQSAQKGTWSLDPVTKESNTQQIGNW